MARGSKVGKAIEDFFHPEPDPDAIRDRRMGFVFPESLADRLALTAHRLGMSQNRLMNLITPAALDLVDEWIRDAKFHSPTTGDVAEQEMFDFLDALDNEADPRHEEAVARAKSEGKRIQERLEARNDG